ncbi:hypothetical protein GS682_21280 [Nostoc sp. B(2019)]|nr:hypothetical protein [Nostoc sp. B(2019)]
MGDIVLSIYILSESAIARILPRSFPTENPARFFEERRVFMYLYSSKECCAMGYVPPQAIAYTA